jgi:lysophospholipase L1-like esterase
MHSPPKRILLVGDSDIARWPEELYPVVPGIAEPAVDAHGNALVSGHSGATLKQVLPYAKQLLGHDKKQIREDSAILIVCAGENDIGMGVPLDSTMAHFKELLDIVLCPRAKQANSHHHHHLIFMGPKFEPWMEQDGDPMGDKKSYCKMDRGFQRICDEFVTQHADNVVSGHIHYIDCLTMFCGDTANLPGARLGGRAVAQNKFFSMDQLHLSDDGYAVWKETVERIIREKCR